MMAAIEPAPSFALSLAKSVNDSLFVEKMEAYAAWGAEEPRLQGWMPFHYDNRLWGPTPDRYEYNRCCLLCSSLVCLSDSLVSVLLTNCCLFRVCLSGLACSGSWGAEAMPLTLAWMDKHKPPPLTDTGTNEAAAARKSDDSAPPSPLVPAHIKIMTAYGYNASAQAGENHLFLQIV